MINESSLKNFFNVINHQIDCLLIFFDISWCFFFQDSYCSKNFAQPSVTFLVLKLNFMKQ